MAAVERGGADLIHVDVMDGHFVPNLTMGPAVVKALRRITKLPLDVHLMITDPDEYIEAFAEAGAASLIVHAEVLPHLHRTLSAIRSLQVPRGRRHQPLDAAISHSGGRWPRGSGARDVGQPRLRRSVLYPGERV